VIESLVADAGELGNRLTARMEEVEERLMSSVGADVESIATATSHLAAAGGKRLRPALCLLTSYLGEDPDHDSVMKSALTVELTHLATLYHDDVMDEAPMRRGVVSVQRLFGNSAAILAGDVLFARASTLVSAIGPHAVKLHAETFERLCMGQLRETLGPREGENPRDAYISVLADKTGSLIAASARYGVLGSRGEAAIADAVGEYGEKVGVAFQLADDVIDIMSDGEVTGKTPGTDLREGVDTMPIILLRERSDEGSLDPTGQVILDRLASGSEEDVVVAVGMLREHPVMAEVTEMARQWADDAIAELTPLPDGEVKEALETFARLMVDRLA